MSIVASVGNYKFRTIFDAPHQWNFCIRPWIHLDYFADFCSHSQIFPTNKMKLSFKQSNQAMNINSKAYHQGNKNNEFILVFSLAAL